MRTWQKLLSSQDKLASDDDFLLYESRKKKLNSTLGNIEVSPVNIHGSAQHSHTSNEKGFKSKKILNVWKAGVSAEADDQRFLPTIEPQMTWKSPSINP